MGAKRTRRSYDQMIDALRQKIATLEERKRKKAMKADPALKLAQKLVRQLKSAEGTFRASRRSDLADAARAGYISLDGNLRATPKSA